MEKSRCDILLCILISQKCLRIEEGKKHSMAELEFSNPLYIVNICFSHFLDFLVKLVSILATGFFFSFDKHNKSLL